MLKAIHKQYLRVTFVTLSIAAVLYTISLPVWENYLVVVGYETLSSFAAILCIASLLLHQRGSSPSAPVLLAAGFLYYAVIELGGAMESLLLSRLPLVQSMAIVNASGLVVMASLGAVLILALVTHQKGLVSDSRRASVSFLLLFLVPLLVTAILRFAIMPELPTEAVITIGISAGIGSIALLLGTGLVLLRHRELFPLNGPVRLPVSCVIFAMSSLPSMIALFNPGPIRTMTIILQLTGFVLIYLALAPTFLSKLNTHRRPAFVFIITITTLMTVPFFFTLLGESVVQGVTFLNEGAYYVSRTGSISMSAALAILIYTYARRTGRKYQYPIALVFSSMTVATLTDMVLSPFLPRSRTLSLILVTLVSIAAFIQSIRWLDGQAPKKDGRSPEAWTVIGFVGTVCLVIVGEVVQSAVLISSPSLDASTLGGSLALGLNAIAFGEFVYFAMLLVASERGKMTVELLSVWFLILWILQSILKAIFLEWTVGWWLGEILLLIGLLAGPALIGYLYLGAFLQAEDSGTRAKVYADVLAHDISNHHQAILSALEIARLDIAPQEMRNKALDEAFEALVDADRLARNVRKLAQVECLDTGEFEPMDLVTSISEAFDRLTKAMRAPDISLNIDAPEGECLILANDLLHDVFLNLLRNAIEHSGRPRVDVLISPIVRARSSCWEVRVMDYGPGIPYERRESLFERYMKGAKGSGLGLSVVRALTELFGGTVGMEDRVKGDYSQGSAFVLLFPAVCPPSAAPSEDDTLS